MPKVCAVVSQIHFIRGFNDLFERHSSLTKQLRELEADGFLIRHDFKEIPPRVEYALSDLGESFTDVITYMKRWGDQNLPDQKCIVESTGRWAKR